MVCNSHLLFNLLKISITYVLSVARTEPGNAPERFSCYGETKKACVRATQLWRNRSVLLIIALGLLFIQRI
uniref:Uncharacterized protein n=1 Tax=Rhizophora mucronata TaxID=61149 RepID=A0A2P2IZ62_RHIMU